jgi:PTH1 family peptidyl-tRNA hydrolase
LPRFTRDGRAKATSGATPHGIVHLLKPQTFMNNSGAVLSGLRAPAPEAALDDLLVLVDDFALTVGTFRLRASGSAGGHNGLKSIEATVGTRHYARLRIGIGPLPRGLDGWRDYVLEPMPRAERRDVEALLPDMCEAVVCWMSEGITAAMARFNRRTPAPEE